MSTLTTFAGRRDTAVLSLMAALTFAILWASILWIGATTTTGTLIFECGAGCLLIIWALLASPRADWLMNDRVLLLLLACFIVPCAQLVWGYVPHFELKAELLLRVAYAAIFVIAASVAIAEEPCNLMLYGFGVFAPVYGLFALLQSVLSEGKIFGVYVPREAPDLVFGSYANRDHYAGLMELMLPCCAVLALRSSGIRATTLFGFGTLLAAISVAVSRSRGGLAIMMLELVLLAVLFPRLERKQRVAIAGSAMVVLAVALVVANFHAKESTLTRMAETNLKQEAHIGRIAMDRDTLHMLPAHPWLGWGLGSFESVYPRYKTIYTVLVIDHAHNDLLETVFEVGVLGSIPVFWLLALVLKRGWEGSFGWDGPENTGSLLRMAAFIGVIGLLIHSLVDFNLHIPATAAVFSAFCGFLAAPTAGYRSMRNFWEP